jgi:hypothetical protein
MIKRITSFSLPINEEDTFSLTIRLKYSEDVKSIDSIVDAYYSIVSYSKLQELNFERLKFLHLNNALIVKIDDCVGTHIISLEAEYSMILNELKKNCYKIEMSRIVTKHGDFAQVLSTYEIRTNPKVPTTIKGSNSIQLHYSNDRWWISTLTIQMETTSILIDELVKRANISY